MDNPQKDLTVHDGFNPGDDNALQQAMLKNLERVHEEQIARGETEQASRTLEDIQALRAHMADDHLHDHNDDLRDDIGVH